MVFDAVVGLSGDLLGDGRPLVAHLVVVLDQHQLLLDRPVRLRRLRIYVILIPKFHPPYRSRHCLALFRDACSSSDIRFAIRLQLRSPSSS
jgi:hypothetical protein